ncbi:alpha/beta hydrolase [Streptomyces sp. CNQ-509]|uniref:alpha/beta hydrolase n=1 Tax=Streptomyces sp. CNQ-509 TaxID=444103 RepID=UPI00069BBCC6
MATPSVAAQPELPTADPVPVGWSTTAGGGLSRVAWADCGTEATPRLQCGSLKVPLDYDRPRGRTITLALNRVPHTAARSQGPLLVNPGGPGGSGLGLAEFVAGALPADVASQYDVIGFDPRGVGSSEPALDCAPGYFDAPRPDSVPTTAAIERANLKRAEGFARSCGEKYGDVLEHINTPDTARDMDTIRRALGADKISYFGYSYGTYLGAVYAKLFPERVRRLALDSVVDPTGVWYEDNLAQDYAFDKRHKAFARWVAEHESTYGLGSDPDAVEAAWYAMRKDVADDPAGGVVGPAELEDTFLPGGYANVFWPDLAEAFAAYVNSGDEDALVQAYEDFGAAGGAAGDNGYSVYAAVECQDAAWPRDWRTWRRDHWRTYAKAPFLTWNNAQFNAPCAFWPTRSLEPVDVTNDELPPTLLFQATDDAATPYPGAVTVKNLLSGSSLVVEDGGGNHSITLGGNDCLDGYLVEYLRSGAVPRGDGTGDTPDADAVCDALPEPEPQPAAATASANSPAASSAADVADRAAALHHLLGTPR